MTAAAPGANRWLFGPGPDLLLGCGVLYVALFAAFDRGQEPDRLDGMLVDGIDMIHIVLGLPDDPAKVGHKAAKHAGFVHPREGNFRLIRRRHNIDEQAVRLGVLTDPTVDLT